MSVYVVMELKEAAKAGVPEALTEVEMDASVFGWCVVRVDDDGSHTWIGQDGGPPEDQLLVREWSWVATALNEAYRHGSASVKTELYFQAGRKKGSQEAIDKMLAWAAKAFVAGDDGEARRIREVARLVGTESGVIV